MYFKRESDTSAVCESPDGRTFRLLASLEAPGEWMICPTGEFPTYYAVPQADSYCYEIRRGRAGEVVGYCMSLSEMARPVDDDLRALAAEDLLAQGR